MGSGGHARSGPAADPNSRTTERRGGLKLTALPYDGYAGDVPLIGDFLPEPLERHAEVWSLLWSTPQACAWAQESWRWPIVADLVKWSVRSDAQDASAAVATTVRQLRDDLGLSAAGLRQNGWAIAPPPEPEPSGDGPAPANVTDIKNRLSRGKT